MPLDWSPLIEFLRRHDRPLLMTHIRPDADGLGSQLALHAALRQLGKQPRVAIASKLPPRYNFLDPARQVIEDFRPSTASNFAGLNCRAYWAYRSRGTRWLVMYHSPSAGTA